MTAVLWLLFAQGLLGALDTLYYHEWRARLPSLGAGARIELVLHASRDFVYCVLFATLPWIAWHGVWAAVVIVLLLAEIVITLTDFVIEDRVRKPMGGVYPGERTMHTIMAIIYGAMIAHFVPVLVEWWSMPSALAVDPPAIPVFLQWACGLMAAGVGLSGLRDLHAAV